LNTVCSHLEPACSHLQPMAKRQLSSSRMCTAMMAAAAASAAFSLLVASVAVHTSSKSLSFVSAYPGQHASGYVTPRRTSTLTVDTTTDAVSNEELPPKEMRPGSTDAAAFNEGLSVAFWHSFNSRNMDGFGESSFPTISDLSGTDSWYWLYHLGRTGFFGSQGLTALAISQLGQRMSDSESTNGGTPQINLFQALTGNLVGTARSLLGEALATYRQDLKNIKQRTFKAPYDMSLRHRQFSPAYVSDTSQRFFHEATKTVAASKARADTKTWVEGDIYPDYYKHTFHYQTAGSPLRAQKSTRPPPRRSLWDARMQCSDQLWFTSRASWTAGTLRAWQPHQVRVRVFSRWHVALAAR